ncbi:MAG: prepilin peptidase [Candidatus Omnitrophica bacterium]|nr:prepilin peptidase [Candidatus Omnitrophota bacterium]
MGNYLDKIFVFMIGAGIGSFLNVCIHRMPKDKSIAFPPSHCPKCNKGLYWYDNIPLFSYVILLGRCRFCRQRISLRYPVVELATALILTVLFVIFGMTSKFFAYSTMACALIVATFVDFEIQEIPDQVSLGGLAAGIALSFLFPSIMDSVSRMHALAGSLAGALTGGGSIFILKIFGTLVFKNKIKELGIGSAMGDGDIKLMAMIGAFLGWKLVLLTFFIAPFLGSVPGIISKIRSGSETIPYGPFLSMAAMISVFFGNKILSMFSYGLF